MSGVEIVGFLCQDGRRLEPQKVQRILDWPVPQPSKDGLALTGTAVHHHTSISDTVTTAPPTFTLFRMGKKFIWTSECQTAMNTIKVKITEAPILITLDFSVSALPIVLHADASSTIEWEPCSPNC
jgi:hypothetical protein